MTRPVYIWVESGGSQLSEEPKVRKTQFGDGYSQRQADGINALGQRWQIRHSEIDDSAADEIVAFLRARNGVEAFEYTPMWHSTPMLFLCSRWTRTASERPGYSDVTADFEQTFEP